MHIYIPIYHLLEGKNSLVVKKVHYKSGHFALNTRSAISNRGNFGESFSLLPHFTSFKMRPAILALLSLLFPSQMPTHIVMLSEEVPLFWVLLVPLWSPEVSLTLKLMVTHSPYSYKVYFKGLSLKLFVSTVGARVPEICSPLITLKSFSITKLNPGASSKVWD